MIMKRRNQLPLNTNLQNCYNNLIGAGVFYYKRFDSAEKTVKNMIDIYIEGPHTYSHILLAAQYLPASELL